MREKQIYFIFKHVPFNNIYNTYDIVLYIYKNTHKSKNSNHHNINKDKLRKISNSLQVLCPVVYLKSLLPNLIR